MKARHFAVGVAVALALAGGIAYTQGVRSLDDAAALAQRVRTGTSMESGLAWVQGLWGSSPAKAQKRGPQGPRVVPVEVTAAVRKKTPLKIDALGTVTPIASVAIKARLETMITAVHFADGAMVKKGDKLFTLDSRQIEAQIAQVEGMLARDRAQQQGAERDVRRFSDLAAKGATPITNLDNAKTQASVFAAAIRADSAQLENLKVQLSYCTIRAPIDGRISAANVKVGNFVRPADLTPLATINQIAPIYVSFTVSQTDLPDVRVAMAEGSAPVEVAVPGEAKKASGQASMIENSVDMTTGMVIVRATMPNQDEVLWPGTLVTADLLLRVEERVVVPSLAVQIGQAGTYVFVIKGGVAQVRAVKVARTLDHESIIESGLAAGELVATDGQLLLGNGTKVRVRNRKAGA